ncbi:MAG: stage III sporulation protein AF [Lachnospiraceae bacterium]
MEAFYGWIRNIICYMLFISVIENLLPGKKYGKYLKLFSGMVLILLVIQPISSGLRLEDKIARYYESFVFQYESDDLKQEILGMEDKRLEQIIGQYEEAVVQDLEQMIREEGLAVSSSQVVIQREQDSADFGKVTQIQLIVYNEAEEGQEVQVGAIVPVDPVVIGSGESEAVPAVSDEDRKQKEQERAGIEKLQKKIVSYYDLEDEYVEIQFVEGQR